MVYTDLYTAVKLEWMGRRPGKRCRADRQRLQQAQEQQKTTMMNKVNRTVDHYGETYSSATIKDLNPHIFQWLSLMDLNVWIISRI